MNPSSAHSAVPRSGTEIVFLHFHHFPSAPSPAWGSPGAAARWLGTESSATGLQGARPEPGGLLQGRSRGYRGVWAPSGSALHRGTAAARAQHSPGGAAGAPLLAAFRRGRGFGHGGRSEGAGPAGGGAGRAGALLERAAGAAAAR